MGRTTTAIISAQPSVSHKQHVAVATVHDSGRSICCSFSSTTTSAVVLVKGVKGWNGKAWYDDDGKRRDEDMILFPFPLSWYMCVFHTRMCINTGIGRGCGKIGVGKAFFFFWAGIFRGSSPSFNHAILRGFRWYFITTTLLVCLSSYSIAFLCCYRNFWYMCISWMLLFWSSGDDVRLPF